MPRAVTNLIDRLVRVLGRHAAATTILVAGFAASAVIGLVLGLLAVATQRSFDQSVYDWLVTMHSPGSTFTQLNETFTGFGDPLPSLWQTLAASAVLMVLFGRRWWIPVIVLPLGFVLVFGLQRLVDILIDRASPPFGPGTFFSGGSARFVVIYGLTLFLIFFRWPAMPQHWRIAGVAIVAVLAFLMGFTRIYLLLHWPTDIPAGWLLGTLITLTVVAATCVWVPTGVASGARRSARLQEPSG